MSHTFPMNSGSGDSLKLLGRRGSRPNARHVFSLRSNGNDMHIVRTRIAVLSYARAKVSVPLGFRYRKLRMCQPMIALVKKSKHDIPLSAAYFREGQWPVFEKHNVYLRQNT
jgi:hypothetical protein